jgi:hypothetical protein
MNIKHLVGGLALAIALVGCKKGGNADIDAFVKLDSEKAVAFKTGGDNCDEKAKAVGDWRKKNAANYKAMQNKLKEQWPKGPPEDVLKKHGDQMKANKTAVIDAMLACTGTASFDKMMDETKVGGD